MPPQGLPKYDNHWIDVAAELEDMAARIRYAVDADDKAYYRIAMRPWQQTAIKAVYRGLTEDNLITKEG
jgi:type VI protein secretion system component VasF